MGDLTATAAQRLAAFAAGPDPGDLPGEVADAAALHLLDTLGCGLAAHALGAGMHARAAVLDAAGEGGATVVGSARRLPAASAALANGTLCHALDFDDTHAGAISHVGAVIGPAALAVAEEAGASGSELLGALAAGSEVVIRIGEAATPDYMVSGFHPTSVCGVFGAAAAAGRLLRLGDVEIAHALGIAGSMAAGLFEYLADGSSTKPLHAGWAAHAGILAAQVAAHGGTGPATVLEGRFGLFHAYFRLDGAALEPLAADLGARWETPRIAFKPYPACHFVHSPLDATRAAAASAAPLDPEEIEEVVVSLPGPGVPLVAEPHEAKTAPRTDYDAKFSVQYSVAAMLVHGEVGVATYAGDAIADPRVLALARRVSCEARAFPTFPASFPGAVRIRLRDGRLLEAELAHERGGPDNPMSEDEIRAKFRSNARLALGEEDTAALESAILSLARVDDIRAVLAPLAAGVPA